MGLIELIMILAVVAFLMWAVTTFIPMEPNIKRILIGAVCFVLVLWVINLMFGPLPDIRVGK